MGIYLNPGNENFCSAVSSRIYVDKTALLEYTNSVIGTEQRYICVSRPRRFGKSMAADMVRLLWQGL
ncbi:MAG: AAA family ATPase [Lachnospiraceae bacterium]|nr:AAA family ATPase [Lachnospiraceae bacterium]